jgi:hypothetical protein
MLWPESFSLYSIVSKLDPSGSIAVENLLNFRFFEFDVLTRDGIVLLEYKLFSRRAGILLRDVEEAGAGRRQQFDFLCNWLRHDRGLK